MFKKLFKGLLKLFSLILLLIFIVFVSSNMVMVHPVIGAVVFAILLILLMAFMNKIV